MGEQDFVASIEPQSNKSHPSRGSSMVLHHPCNRVRASPVHCRLPERRTMLRERFTLESHLPISSAAGVLGRFMGRRWLLRCPKLKEP